MTFHFDLEPAIPHSKRPSQGQVLALSHRTLTEQTTRMSGGELTSSMPFTVQAHMLAEVMEALGIERVDLVGNDSDDAITQIFAVHYPGRLISLVLTNCDLHDGVS